MKTVITAWSHAFAGKVITPTSLSNKAKGWTRSGHLFVHQGKDEPHYVWVMWHIHLLINLGLIIWRCDKCSKMTRVIDWNGLSWETEARWCYYSQTRIKQGEGDEPDWTFNLETPSAVMSQSSTNELTVSAMKYCHIKDLFQDPSVVASKSKWQTCRRPYET